MSGKHGTGLGIQPPPIPPGKGNTPGWGNFNPGGKGTAAEAAEGAGGGVFFPWYTVPPDNGEQSEDAEEEEEGKTIL